MNNEFPAKDRIITWVREKMLAEGFAHLSVDEIVKNLGMSKKTFYKIFPTKEDLINQVADRIMAEGRANFARIIESDKDFVSKTYELMSFVALQSTRISRALQNDVQRHAPGLWSRIQEFRKHRIEDVFSRLIDQGMREGYVRNDLNKRIFLLVLLESIGNVVTPAVLIQESFSAREAVDNILGLFFRGILTDKARKELDQLQITGHPSLPL